MKTALETESINDVQLVERSRNGDRDAFGRIVERYQSLVCALTYSACGNLQTSEDLAQVTFITAWCELRKLQEPSKLKSWLCGIARNVTNNSFRRDKRTPTAHAETLDSVPELSSGAFSPRGHAISKEEEAILWRSLGELPPTYREPLVLFYRQHQSVAEVADALEISEDVVRQRLSRGRTMLTEKVTAFIEGALRDTAPGAEFAGAVLAALPMGAGAVASIGAAAKGTAATKSAGLFAWLAPLVGIIGGMTAHWLIVRASPTPGERRVKMFSVIGCWLFVLIWAFLGQVAMRSLSAHLQWSDRMFYVAMAGFWWIFAVVIATLVMVMFRRVMAIRKQGEEASKVPKPMSTPLKPGARAVAATGAYLAYFWGLIYIAWRAHDQGAAGVIAAVAMVLGIGYYFQLRGETGTAAMRAAIGHVALAFGAMLVVLNLRLDVWLAGIRGVDLPEMHRLLPMWIVHVLTLAWVIWVGALVAMTRPKGSK